MGNFFGSLVGAAPYVSRLLAQRQAQDEQDKATALKNVYAKNADDRANAMLKIAQANSDRQAEGEWEKAEPMTQDDGSTIMAQRNKKTGEYRPATMGKPSMPGLPINAAPKSMIPNSAIGLGQSKAPALPMAGDSQDMSGARDPMPQQPVTSTEQAPVVPPKPRTLKPYVKPTVNPPRNPVADHAANRDYDVAHPLPQQGDKTLVQIEGPDGTPIWVPREQAIGKQAKTTTRVESATNTAAQARLQAAVSEMNNAHANMSEYEQKLSNKTAHISASAQVLQRVANAFTHDDPLSQLTQSGALSALNASDPELARYIRRGLSFAEGESMVSQRPSDFRTKMAAFLSTAGSNASPEMIADIAGRRTSILNPLNSTVGTPKPAKGGGRGGAPGTPPPNVPHPTSKGDTPGNINLGGDPESAWAAKNPPQKGETFEAYHARYLKSGGGNDSSEPDVSGGRSLP